MYLHVNLHWLIFISSSCLFLFHSISLPDPISLILIFMLILPSLSLSKELSYLSTYLAALSHNLSILDHSFPAAIIMLKLSHDILVKQRWMTIQHKKCQQLTDSDLDFHYNVKILRAYWKIITVKISTEQGWGWPPF